MKLLYQKASFGFRGQHKVSENHEPPPVFASTTKNISTALVHYKFLLSGPLPRLDPDKIGKRQTNSGSRYV